MKYRIELKDGNEKEFFFPELDCSVEIEENQNVADATLADLASHAFGEALNGIRRSKKKIPLPDGTGKCAVNFSTQIKIHLWNWMVENRYRATDIADRLGINRQQTARIMDFRHPTDIKTLLTVCDALGAEICVSIKSK